MADTATGAFEDTVLVQGAPHEVFDFVSDVRNLPKYLPTTKHAEPQGPDRVRVQGEAHGHAYDGDGYLRADRQAMRLEWGADEGYYSGHLQIQPDGEGCYVTVGLTLKGGPPGSEGKGGPSPEDVQEGIRKGLESIKNHVEGQGGKEEPAAAT